jgi:hypothetical protein
VSESTPLLAAACGRRGAPRAANSRPHAERRRPAAREARGRNQAKRRDEVIIEIARVSRKIRTEQAGRS